MNNFSRLNLASCAALTACFAIAAGCGGAEGIHDGASSATQVTVKHEKAQAQPAATGQSQSGSVAPSAAAAAGFGTLHGKVVFKGTPPSLPPLYEKGGAIKADAALCVRDNAIPNEKLVVGPGNGVANVFIYIPRVPAGVAIPPAPDAPIDFDQKGCHFIPHALIVRAGQTVKILNSDLVAHNTHTGALRSENFNKLLPPGDKAGLDFKYKLPEPKPAEVKCDIHSWMHAYQLPLDHPWGAVSGPDGSFEIKNVPAGPQKFQVWHESASGGFLDRNLSVTIKPGEVTTVEIPYDASKLEL